MTGCIALLCWLALASPSPRLTLLPALARTLEMPQPPPVGVGEKAVGPFSVVAALDVDAAAVLNRLFGSCFPLERGALGLQADLCVPVVGGAPKLLLLAAERAPLSALVLSDVWVAALPSGFSDAHVSELLEWAVDALARLPSPPAGAAPRQLLLVTTNDAQPTLATKLQRRLHELWMTRRSRGLSVGEAGVVAARKDGDDDDLSVELALAARLQVTVEPSGPTLLARFAQTSRADYLLPSDGACIAADITMRQVPLLLDELTAILDRVPSHPPDHTPATAPLACRRANAGEWAALVGCEAARQSALESVESSVEALREALLDSTLNPLCSGEFASLADGVVTGSLASYRSRATRWSQTLAYAAKHEQLYRGLLAMLLGLLRLQLRLLREDALTTFRAELALLIATSVTYRRHAARLVKRSSAHYKKLARQAVPVSLVADARGAASASASSSAAVASAAAVLRSGKALLKAMCAEGREHEEAADALPPREQDVGPPLWYKQILTQVLVVGLNLLQSYLLQHLPARRSERADERAMPRAPLF